MFDTLFAKKSALSALGAKRTPGKVYTYDGKAEKVETVGNYTYAIIATDAPSLSELTKAVGTFADGSTVEFSKEELSFETLGESIEAASATLMGMTVPLIVWEDGVLLVYSMEGVGYGSRAEFAETVVPIDPKFLPGVCLPVVVDLSNYEASGQTFSELIEGLVMNGGGTVSVDVEQFMKDASTDGVLILELEVMDTTVRTSAVTSMLNHFDYTTEQLCFSTLVDMGTGLMNVSVLIDRFNTDGSITVAVS